MSRVEGAVSSSGIVCHFVRLHSHTSQSHISKQEVTIKCARKMLIKGLAMHDLGSSKIEQVARIVLFHSIANGDKRARLDAIDAKGYRRKRRTYAYCKLTPDEMQCSI